MEPALDERGDASLPMLRTLRVTRQPQWSPLSTSGATPIGPQRPQANPSPQWSPLSTSGATKLLRGQLSARQVAAMEPALDERGDVVVVVVLVLVERAAMEPALDERGDLVGPRRGEGEVGAAMEPALDERGDRRTRSPAGMPERRRNGARSRRAGRPGSAGNASAPAGSRNGARSRRAGRPCHCPSSRRPATRRNGARSRRAGRLIPEGTQVTLRSLPQWSPLSTSGATSRMQDCRHCSGVPQWSPLSTSGATRPWAATHPAGSLAPQWSPLSTSGATAREMQACDLRRRGVLRAPACAGDRSGFSMEFSSNNTALELDASTYAETCLRLGARGIG